MAQPKELGEADLDEIFGGRDPNAAAIRAKYPDAVCVKNGYSVYHVLSDFGDNPQTTRPLGVGGRTRAEAWESAAKSEFAP